MIKKLTNSPILFSQVIDYFGGIPSMAKRLKVTRHTIYMWEKRRSLPKGRAYQLELLSKGHFRAMQLMTNCLFATE